MMAPDGILLLDKPAGMTSAQLVAAVKRITRARKVGHTGTLDPAATGLMILGINRGTRLAQFFLKGTKSYRGTLGLGVETDTQDAEGKVTATQAVPALDENQIRAVLAMFTGPQEQLPPPHSALKHQGVPLYKLARRGTPVQKPPRPIEISALALLEWAPPDVVFSVTCSAGTYVRTLCADIGRQIGCGGHLKALTRTASCGFQLSQALDLDALTQETRVGHLDRVVVPLAAALPHLPAITADKVLTEKIKYGRMISLTEIEPKQLHIPPGPVKIVDRQNQLLAVVAFNPARSQLTYQGVYI